MTDYKFKYKLAMTIVKDIAELHQAIKIIFPKEKSKLLKHMAASAIHLAFFAKDLAQDLEGKLNDTEFKEVQERFLKQCECDFNGKNE